MHVIRYSGTAIPISDCVHFRRNALQAFLPYVIDFDMFVRSARRHSWNISIAVWSRITKFYVDIHTDIVHSHTGYDVIVYFRSEVIAKNCRQYRLRWLWVEFLDKGLSQDHHILRIYRGQSAWQTRVRMTLNCRTPNDFFSITSRH